MTRNALCFVAVGLAACGGQTATRPPPEQQFYFPSGLTHADALGSPEGVLYVSNGNFDKRFDNGTVVAVRLDALGLPAFGDPVSPAGPVQLKDLRLDLDVGTVKIASFAGEMGVWPRPEGGVRLFIPSRSEGDYLQVIDAPAPLLGAVPRLDCVTAQAGSRDCASAAFSLSSFQDKATSLPRAVAPYGVAVARDGDVFVTHLSNADSPRGSNKNLNAYVVKLRADAPSVDTSSFFPLGPGAVNSVAVGQRWVYLSGRVLTGGTQLVRLMSRDGALISGSLESELGIVDARGLALASDESRLYLAGRGPDRLVVASIAGPDSDAPYLRLMRVVPLPSAPNAVVTIPRAGRSDLVAISCSSAGVLALYDDDVGALTAQVPGLGLQPFSIAADLRGAGARLFVSNFADGRVAVLDVPDLNRPQQARVVAHLGADQLCLTRSEREGKCTGEGQ